MVPDIDTLYQYHLEVKVKLGDLAVKPELLAFGATMRLG
jgi:hypothetical protein